MMVSTSAASQYISDFSTSPSTTDSTKSPLAMLAKTCETIGLPDAPAKRTPDKKDAGLNDAKKSESPVPKRKDGSRSPRTTPKNGSDTATSLGAGMPKSATAATMGFPFGMPMGFPLHLSGMIPYPPMSYPAFAMPPYMRCPAAMLGRPCTTPGCPTCTPTSSASDAAALSAAAAAAAASAFPMMPPFAYPFMPTTSTATSLPASYQQMLQAAVASATAPSASAKTSPASPAPAQYSCCWATDGAICAKKFATSDELNAHVKSHTTSSTPSPSPVQKSPASTSSSARFHPYAKPATSSSSASATLPSPALPTAPFPFPAMPFPAALQAMYAQRLMTPLPHP